MRTAIGIRFLATLAMAGAMLWPQLAGAQPGHPGDPGVEVIQPGIDCWDTECGQTRFSFCDLPIPADFFAPGSEPFRGEVFFQGRTGTQFDTQVQRQAVIELPGIGSTDTVPIELVQLQLVSCAPIDVRSESGTTPWDVVVTLSPVPAPPGTLTATKTHANGGTFDSSFFVQPQFTFIRIDDPTQVRILDTGLLGLPPDHLQILGEVPWVSDLDPSVEADSCSPTFAPGVREPLKGKGSQCCVVTCHSGATATHCIEIDRDCSGCPSGACCLGRQGRCAEVKARKNATAQQVCEGRGGVYHGDGSTCGDTDGDGIPDIKENNNCCGPRDACRVGSSPTLADTDGDTVDDGTELKQGTDPCDPSVGAGGE